MTIEQAMINIEKELKCRKENCTGWCHECPAFVSYDDETDTLQTIYDYFHAERRNNES